MFCKRLFDDYSLNERVFYEKTKCVTLYMLSWQEQSEDTTGVIK